MNLPDLKQLDKIIALCRKRGVKSIEIDNVKLTLSDEAPQSEYKKAKERHSVTDSVETDAPTDEELLFWSVGDPIEETKSSQ